jgi:hypothetical protein
MWSLRRPAGAGGSIPASAGGGTRRERRGGALGVREGRFRPLAGPVVAPASGALTAGGGSRRGSCCGAGVALPRQGAAQAGAMGAEVTLGHGFLQWRWPEVVVPPARRPWRRRVPRRAAGKGWCTQRRLEALCTRVLACFSGKGERAFRGTARRGEKTAVCPAVRRGARSVSPARRAAGSWREGGEFPRASVRERPGEGARRGC